MKTAKILVVLVPAFCFVVCPAKVSQAAPMGTAFTYQGHLYDANYAANGLYDFQFKLYDANSGGVQLGNDVNKPDFDVIDGYLTVELDFGTGVFTGDARWLEIGVRPGDLNDPNVYTSLSPRQEVTPTPYAIYAETAGSFPGFISGSGTANYIAKFTGPDAIGNSVIYESAGSVGIGTDSPSAKLEVNGDLKITGAYKGNIGPNNGAPFPRPAYNSGWIDIMHGDYFTFYHNIGGDPNNYVVHTQERGPGYEGICNLNGTPWRNLTSTSIQVRISIQDGQVRIRIWVYN
jgi:hypothetical protein